MRTTVTLDESLVHELLQVSAKSNKTAAVTHAVKEQIRRAKLEKLAGLLGSLVIDEDAIADAQKAEAVRNQFLHDIGSSGGK